MFPSREDRAATDKPKHPCSTNFRQSTWKSSKQNQRSLRKLVKLDNKMLRWHSSTLTTEQLSRAKTSLLVILLCLGITRIIGSLNYWRASAKTKTKEITATIHMKVTNHKEPRRTPSKQPASSEEELERLARIFWINHRAKRRKAKTIPDSLRNTT